MQTTLFLFCVGLGRAYPMGVTESVDSTYVREAFFIGQVPKRGTHVHIEPKTGTY